MPSQSWKPNTKCTWCIFKWCTSAFRRFRR